MSMHYGHFHGGDPRNFEPDVDACLPQEIESHRRACQLWDEAEARGETPTLEACPSGFIFGPDGAVIAHVLRAPYGIGVTMDGDA